MWCNQKGKALMVVVNFAAAVDAVECYCELYTTMQGPFYSSPLQLAASIPYHLPLFPSSSNATKRQNLFSPCFITKFSSARYTTAWYCWCCCRVITNHHEHWWRLPLLLSWFPSFSFFALTSNTFQKNYFRMGKNWEKKQFDCVEYDDDWRALQLVLLHITSNFSTILEKHYHAHPLCIMFCFIPQFWKSQCVALPCISILLAHVC